MEGFTTLQKVSFIFMIIGCVSVGWMLIPLAWCIPMTIKYYKALKEGKALELPMAFKICTLIFVSLVSGIIMLIDKGE
ncbi:MAG: hypothetical protein J5879_05685 [Clostridia bacterium]|nr:hypothetical protein [Clostridia bacterium]